MADLYIFQMYSYHAFSGLLGSTLLNCLLRLASLITCIIDEQL